MIERLSFILKKESISFEREALMLIAKEGKGSMRDALTLLDQLITFEMGMFLLRH